MVSKFVKDLPKNLNLNLKKSECEIGPGYGTGSPGFSLYWELKKLKYDCIIVAPGPPTQPKGVRQKNNARDAERLADDMCNRTCSEVHMPDPLDEEIRDFLRLRQDAVGEAGYIRQQRNAYAAQKGFVYTRTKGRGTHRVAERASSGRPGQGGSERIPGPADHCAAADQHIRPADRSAG